MVPFVGAPVFDGVFLWLDVTEELLAVVLSEVVGILGIAGLREEDRFVLSDASESFVNFVVIGLVAFIAGKEVQYGAALG